MARKRLSRGRGPRLREEELDRMVALYLEGKSFKAIGAEVGRHWQTVRKYTIKALQEREGRELRREALKAALAEHFQDLVHALGSIGDLLELPAVARWNSSSEWVPACPDRQNRLLLQSLQESHAKESPLWGWWDSWKKSRQDYEQALSSLRQRVATEITGLENSNLEPSLTFNKDQLAQVLFEQAYSMAQDALLYDPSMLRVKSIAGQKGKGNKEELWLGESAKLADGQDVARVRERLSDLMKNMREWGEVTELQRIYHEIAKTRELIDEEIEVLSLRRAFPGRCRLCPI